MIIKGIMQKMYIKMDFDKIMDGIIGYGIGYKYKTKNRGISKDIFTIVCNNK
ncbi:MAG: hypothetical protein LBK13_09795 [Spirochaetales bacterium]|jgi:hypothetical protein|nr:hypothetical protein [Spirochaetales bacterium]